MTSIYPVLLAGGSGTRLWPLSRKSHPKQFSKIVGEETLFQQSALRLTSSDILNFMPPITLTNSDFRFLVGEQLQGVGIDPGVILIEPDMKNTGPAILAASLLAYKKDNNAILLVAPSDHIIPDKQAFHSTIKVGLNYIASGKLVTFGITPTYPKTGYGYLKLHKESLDDFGSSKVKHFIEKPKIELAENLINEGSSLWNSGIFLFKARDMIEAWKKFNDLALRLTRNSLENARIDLGFLRLDKKYWDRLENISIDYAIMEKADNLIAVPFSSKWSDLGDWESVWNECVKDKFGVVLSGNAHANLCSDTILRSENDDQLVVGLGLKNIIAIAMPDAVLVANKEKAQELRDIVESLSLKNLVQAEVFPKDYRPWGWFESLSFGDRFQVKKIFVKPGGALSLQSHKHRSEHWIVVEGEAKVTVDNEVNILNEGESVYVPIGSIHRLENESNVPMALIEVQTGSYLGEDDIIRYEDLYARE